MFTLANFMTTIHRFKSTCFNTLLAPNCLLCGFPIKANTQLYLDREASNRICKPCFHDLPILPDHCERCAAFLPSNHQTTHCGMCLSKPPAFDICHALFPYEPPISQLIIKLKYSGQLPFATLLAELFINKIKNDWYSDQRLPDIILPMPLHNKRVKKRGFNQSVEIAKPIAQKLGIPFTLNGVIRQKATLSQRGLTAKAREENMAHAFIHKQSYANLHIAILDDVVTTGQTIAACSEALQAAKVRRIDVWCAARR